MCENTGGEVLGKNDVGIEWGMECCIEAVPQRIGLGGLNAGEP